MGEVLTAEVKSRADHINTGKTVRVLLTLDLLSVSRFTVTLEESSFVIAVKESDCMNSYWVVMFCAWEEISYMEIFNSPREPCT